MMTGAVAGLTHLARRISKHAEKGGSAAAFVE